MKSNSHRYLFPIGGNESIKPDSVFFHTMLKHAGGDKARIVIIPTASDVAKERGLYYQKALSKFTYRSIHLVEIKERSDSSDPKLLKHVADSTLIIFSGGDQLRLSSLIGGTPLHTALIDRYLAGNCVITGTSAGAAFLPDIMIYQNRMFHAYQKGGIEMTKGLGLIQDVIFDTHFSERARISRLIHSVATNPSLLGFGLDENTGLLIEDETRAKVIGTGNVIVADGTHIDINHIGYVKNGESFTISNVIYSLLTPGVVYDMTQKRIVNPGPIETKTCMS